MPNLTKTRLPNTVNHRFKVPVNGKMANLLLQ